MGYYISQKDYDKIINYAKAAYDTMSSEIGGMSICYKDKDDTKKKKATAKKAKAATKIQAVARGKKQRKVALAKVKKPTGPKVKAAVEKIEIKKPKRGQVIIAHSGDHTGFLGIVKSIDGERIELALLDKDRFKTPADAEQEEKDIHRKALGQVKKDLK